MIYKTRYFCATTLVETSNIIPNSEKPRTDAADTQEVNQWKANNAILESRLNSVLKQLDQKNLELAAASPKSPVAPLGGMGKQAVTLETTPAAARSQNWRYEALLEQYKNLQQEKLRLESEFATLSVTKAQDAPECKQLAARMDMNARQLKNTEDQLARFANYLQDLESSQAKIQILTQQQVKLQEQLSAARVARAASHPPLEIIRPATRDYNNSHRIYATVKINAHTESDPLIENVIFEQSTYWQIFQASSAFQNLKFVSVAQDPNRFNQLLTRQRIFPEPLGKSNYVDLSITLEPQDITNVEALELVNAYMKAYIAWKSDDLNKEKDAALAALNQEHKSLSSEIAMLRNRQYVIQKAMNAP